MCTALVVGALLGGLLGNYYGYWENYINGVGNIFLHAINMIVIPLVFLSTFLGISTMSNSSSLGRIAIKTFGYFIITALISAVVGIFITNALRPGYGTHCIESESNSILDNASEIGNSTFMDRLVEIVPNNIFSVLSAGDILPIIFFSILLGISVTKIKQNQQSTINNVLTSFNDAILNMTNAIIRFAPLGVFAIVMSLVGKQAGDMETLRNNMLNFAFFIIVVWISLIVMGGIILPLMVGFGAKVSPIQHFKQIYSAMMLAFSTSSSYSALPLIISDAKEKFGVSNNIASFTIPLGITFNKIGTVIYECVAVIFVAQAAEIDLSIAQQLSLVGASIVTVLGAPSVPMAGVVVLAILLKAMNLPEEYIGMFMAIDILCDMPKTMLNAYSVSCSAIIVARSEGENISVA